MPDLSDLILKSFIDNIPMMWEVFSPILIPILVGSIAWGILKFISRKFVYFFSVVSGDTRRETRRKLKMSDDLIDLASNAKDLLPKKK